MFKKAKSVSRMAASYKVEPKAVISLVLSALVSRTELFGEIMPFGAALYAAEYIAKPPLLAGLIAVISALFPSFLPIAALKYALSIVLFSIFAAKKNNLILKTSFRRGAAMGASVFSSGFLLLLGGQILLYDCFALFVEAGITCAAVCLFAHAKKTIYCGRMRETPLDTISVAALCGIAVLGIGGLFRLYGLHLTIPLCVLLTLLLAHESGLTAGALAGITLGLLSTLESGNPVLGAFAVGGMAAGYFSGFGKAGAAVSFIAANSIITFYTGGKAEMVLNLYEILAPVLIYIAMPHAITAKLSIRQQISRGHTARLCTLLSETLHEKATAFTCLSNTLTDISSTEDAATGAFFERAARHACDGCQKLSFCWKKEFHRTYAALFVMLEICTKKGYVTVEDIPISLEEKCIQKASMVRAVNTMYEVYKVDKLWESRVRESRAMVSAQLAGMAGILQAMEKNVKSGTIFNSVTEELLRTRLSEKYIAVHDILVAENRHGQLSVHLRTNSTADYAQITATISDTLGMEMEVTSCRNGYIRLIPKERYALRIASRTAVKDHSEKSGDSFDSLYMENGTFLLALSDGMGSGVRAGADSRAAVHMLKTMLSAGFDTKTALSLVNSVLMLKSADETFATVDLALVNLKNGALELCKVGAADSFIKHGNTVRRISAGTLPVGVVSTPDVARFKDRLAPGDTLILVTDGIAEADRQNAEDDWIISVIQGFTGKDPGALAETILQSAKGRCGGKVQDDMTILTATMEIVQKSTAEIA